MKLIALGLFGTLLLLLNQSAESTYISDTSHVEEPSSLIGESDVAENTFSILRKKKKNRPAKKTKVPAEPRCSASSPEKPIIIDNENPAKITPLSTPNGRFVRQRCGWHFKAAMGLNLSLKCRIKKRALVNCKKAYLRVNGKKYCGKVSEIEIPASEEISLKFTAKLTGKSGFACKVTSLDACPNPWKGFKGFCYKHSTVKASWSNASLACQGEGGNLSSIHSQEENNFHQSLIGSGRFTWFGLRNATNTSLTWSDGTPLDYEAEWYDDDKGIFPCGGFLISPGKWSTTPGCTSGAYYLCKKRFDLF